MDFGKAFSYPFEDPDWAKKIIIPALITLIPIFGEIFILGWMLDIVRRVIRRDPTPLPELDLGRQFVDGLKALVVGLVFAIPILILELPTIILSVNSSSGNMDQQTANGLITIVSLCCGGLVIIYALLMAFVTPAAYANMVAKDQLSAAFRFSELWTLIRANPGAWLMVFLGVLVTGFIAPLGTIACVVGVLLTATYAMVVNAHLYGQAYNASVQNQGFARIY